MFALSSSVKTGACLLPFHTCLFSSAAALFPYHRSPCLFGHSLFFIHAEEKYAIALYPWLLYKYFKLQSKFTVLCKAETYMGEAEVAIIRDLKGWNVPKDLYLNRSTLETAIHVPEPLLVAPVEFLLLLL